MIYSSLLHGFIHKYDSIKDQFRTSFNDGEKHLREGNFGTALESFESGLSLAKTAGYEWGEVECYKSIGLIFWNLGQLDKSKEFYAKAQIFADKYGLDKTNKELFWYIEIFQLYTEGKIKRASNDYQGSIFIFQKAIDLAKANRSKPHELKCLRQLSLTYWELNDLSMFYRLNKQCLTIARELNHKREVGKACNNIGLYYWKSNEYSKALSIYQEALNIARELNDKVEMSACFNNIGVVFKELGFYTRALDYIEEALKIDEALGDRLFLSGELNNLGIISHRKALFSGLDNDFFRALNYFEDSLELAHEVNDIRTEVRALNNIGNVYLDLGKFNNASMYLQQGLHRSELSNDEEALSMILINIGRTKINLKMINDAARSFVKAIELGKKLTRREILWEAYFGLGQCCELKGEFSDAVFYFKMAISVIDRIRSQISMDTFKSSFARNKQKVYESLIGLLFRLQKSENSEELGEIFHIIESAKARAFLETLGESKVDILERLSPELREQEKAVSNQISLTIRKLTGEELTGNERMNLLQELKKAEDDYSLLMQKIRIKVPEVANAVAPVPCRVDQVQDRIIDNKTALIEYFLGEKESYVFFVTKKEIKLHLLPSREDLWKSLKAYLKILTTHPDKEFQGIKASRRIGRELFGPEFWNMPESIEHLIIIPDGVLYYLPFETLILGLRNGKSSDSFLVSKYKISYAPSSSSLLFLTEKTSNSFPKELLAFGNPAYTWNGKTSKKNIIPSEILKEVYQSEGFDLASLPYSEREVKEISKFFPEAKLDLYLKHNASEKAIKNCELSDYQILHFACHAILDEKFPFRSALVLSKEDSLDEDGFLQVSEIYNLRMNSNLVILSACQTGRGRLEKGEGVLGFPRIFFYSGARSVVSTLWKIDDKSTSVFMNYFYGFLSQGKNKAQSLRLAKLEMIKSRYKHPFYWAAFVLNGDFASGITFNTRN